MANDRPRSDEHLRDNWLADYRAAVERLRDETVCEFGAQPMPPEKLSMIAVAVAALPMMALLLPTIPFTLQVWQVVLVQAVVWLVAFRIQRRRYERFQAAWQGKVVAHRAFVAAPPDAGRRLRRR